MKEKFGFFATMPPFMEYWLLRDYNVFHPGFDLMSNEYLTIHPSFEVIAVIAVLSSVSVGLWRTTVVQYCYRFIIGFIIAVGSLFLSFLSYL